MTVKKPTEQHRVCSFFVRQVQSKYFHGIKCQQYFISDNVGQLPQWTEDERDKKLKQHCFDNYLECPIYQGQKDHIKRK